MKIERKKEFKAVKITHNQRLLWIIGFLVILLFVLIHFIRVEQSKQNNPNNSESCLIDNDCIPATCCHPTSCVNKNLAPNCSGVACTMDCKLGTLDCGQASCGCVNKRCQVIQN